LLLRACDVVLAGGKDKGKGKGKGFGVWTTGCAGGGVFTGEGGVLQPLKKAKAVEPMATMAWESDR
jgi:hypothetical protein